MLEGASAPLFLGVNLAKRLIDYDPFTETTSWFEYDAILDKTTIYTEQNVDRYIEANKKRQSNPDYFGYGVKQEYAHVATVPNSVIHKWMKEGINFYRSDDWPKVRKKLNDPEWKYLKTFTGKV